MICSYEQFWQSRPSVEAGAARNAPPRPRAWRQPRGSPLSADRMLRPFLVAVLVILGSCKDNGQKTGETEPSELHVNQSEPFEDYPSQFDRAWVTSSRWHGRMGIAIALHGNDYSYWRYSDLRSDSGPLRGSYRIENGRLILAPPTAGLRSKSDWEDPLYARVWYLGDEGARLLSESDVFSYTGRELVSDNQFDAQHPFRNQPNLKAQK